MKPNYMEKLDAWLNGAIDQLFDAVQNQPAPEGAAGVSAFKKAVKDKVLESYRNGQRSRRSRLADPSSEKE
jgi:hypothetical protein